MMTLTRAPLARLARTPRGWLPILGWTLFGILGAFFSRTTGHTSGADHVLRGTFGFVILPLLTYGIVSATLGGAGLRSAVRGLVALGASPPRAVLASVAVAVVTSAVLAALVASVVCVIAHGPTDPPLARDVPASFGVAFTGGAAYAAYFCAGSAIGRGAMRGLFLAVDWIIGAGGGLGAVFTPRGHLTSLFGGHACFELSRRTSSVVLVLLLVMYTATAVQLGRRAR